jgi:hypothetical protein
MLEDSWLPEARVQALCGIARPTWKSWVRAGLIEEDPGGSYDERQVLGVALIATLREHLGPHQTRTALQALARDGRWNDLLDRSRELADGGRFDLVLEPHSLIVRLATDDAALIAAVRHPGDPRPVVVLPVADRLRRIRDGFRTMALTGERPRARKPGRPAYPTVARLSRVERNP